METPVSLPTRCSHYSLSKVACQPLAFHSQPIHSRGLGSTCVMRLSPLSTCSFYSIGDWPSMGSDHFVPNQATQGVWEREPRTTTNHSPNYVIRPYGPWAVNSIWPMLATIPEIAETRRLLGVTSSFVQKPFRLKMRMPQNRRRRHHMTYGTSGWRMSLWGS